jgi:hypothetical protein
MPNYRAAIFEYTARANISYVALSSSPPHVDPQLLLDISANSLAVKVHHIRRHLFVLVQSPTGLPAFRRPGLIPQPDLLHYNAFH